MKVLSIKKFINFVLIFMLLVCQLIPMQISEAASKNTILKAYSQFLSSKHKLWTYGSSYSTDSTIKFRVEDLNADGKPELLIHNDYASNGDGQLAVYAYINGRVKYVSSYPLWSVTFYRNKSGLVYSEISRGGESNGYYEVFNKKKMNMKYYWNATLDMDTYEMQGKNYYNSKNKKISKMTFNRGVKKLKAGGNKLKISEGARNMYKNTSENRKLYLRLNH